MTPELTQNAPALLALIDNAMDAIVSVDEKFDVILFNRAAEEMFGHPAKAVLGQSLDRLIPERFRPNHARQVKAFGQTGDTHRTMGKLGVVTGLHADGREIPLEAAISRHKDGDRTIYSVILRDTTEWLRVEKALQAQKDLYAMLSLTGQAISQGKDQESLFEEICRIAVECGHFRFAWVGWLNAHEDSFDPVKIHGNDYGTVMEQFRFPQEQRKQVHAMRMGLLEKDGQIIINDLADKAAGTSWQALAEKAGVLSAALFPIRKEGKIQGIIAMYSAEANYFTEMLIPTLQIIASDLSSGLENLAKANKLLRTIQANQLLAEIVRGMDEACFALDKDWRFTFVNDRGQTLLKHSREEMIGKSMWDVFDKLKGTPMEKNYQRAMAERVPITFEAFSPIAERWLDIRLFPSGNGLAAFLMDISSRKESEAKLAHSGEQFRQVVENIEEVFWAIDPEKNAITYISPAYERVWGRPGKTLLENRFSWLEAVHPDDKERVRKALPGQREGKYNLEYRIIRPDGAERWILARAFPVLDEKGSLQRIVGVAEDITSRKQLELQMRQAQKMEAIGQLSAGVAHDFNNLLTVIQGNSSLIVDEKDPEQIKLFTTEITEATTRAASLTRQLLLFGRKQALQPVELDLNKVIRETGAMLKRIVGEDIDLRFQTPAEPIFAKADTGMMNQVLVNLAVNSRDAMPKGGQLLIDVSLSHFDEAKALATSGAKAGTFACISVSDTGTGIPEEALTHIFEPFFTTKDVGRGTGLGLATVFGIMQQHGGWINVFSQVGKGTTFRAYLPAIKTLENPAAVATAKPIARGQETILLVEDEAPVRKMVKTLLASLGYRIFEAETGKVALAVWKEHASKIDMLMTDVIMPDGMNGVELSQKLLSSAPGLRVLLTSGYSADLVSSHESAKQGFNFISKPYDLQTLAEAVRNCLDQPQNTPAQK